MQGVSRTSLNDSLKKSSDKFRMWAFYKKTEQDSSKNPNHKRTKSNK